MNHTTYNLREIYPQLATKDVQTLTLERDQYLKEKQLDRPKYWEPTLTSYCPNTSKEIDINLKRPTILICPGGGYNFCTDGEAEPVALTFVSMGYNAFVLKYECAPVRYPQQLLEVAGAMAFIRKNSDEFHVDKDKIVICGFSAGAHVAASLSSFWREKFISETLNIKNEDTKPNLAVLSYPVITSGEFSLFRCFDALLGEKISEETLEKMSLEKQINDGVPPTFLWQTVEDELVPVENSMLYAKALKEHNIAFELHIYQNGPHGLALANEMSTKDENKLLPNVQTWIKLCDNFIKGNFN